MANRTSGSKVWLFALAGLVLRTLAGCAYTANQPPETTTPPPPVPASHVGLSVSAPMSLAQTPVNNAVPPTLDAAPYNVHLNGGADNCGNGVSLGYHVQRSPISVTGAGSTVSATTELDYWIDGRARWPCAKILGHNISGPLIYGSCGKNKSLRRMTLGLNANFTGIDASWNPLINLALIGPTPLDECKVTKLNKDVTAAITGAMSGAVNGSLPQLNQALVNGIKLPGRAQQGWNALLQPIAVAPSAYLVIHPSSVGVFPFVATPDTLFAGLQVVASPEVILSASSPPPDRTPLPQPGSVPPSNAFFVAFPIEADYKYINSQLESVFKIDKGGIRYPPTGDQYAKVTGASVYAYGQKAVLRLDLKVSGIFGPKAIVYLVGTPKYDALHNVLSFPDLDFTVDSASILLQVAAWLDQSSLRVDLRARAQIDLSAQVNDARAKLQSALNRQMGVAKLTGSVDSLDLMGIYASPSDSQFKVVLKTSGTLNVLIAP